MTFDREPSTGKSSVDGPKARLGALRAELSRRGLDGFIVPLFDEFQGEYIPLHRQRLKWLTGFTGSAGSAVVSGDGGISGRAASTGLSSTPTNSAPASCTALRNSLTALGVCSQGS